MGGVRGQPMAFSFFFSQSPLWRHQSGSPLSDALVSVTAAAALAGSCVIKPRRTGRWSSVPPAPTDVLPPVVSTGKRIECETPRICDKLWSGKKRSENLSDANDTVKWIAVRSILLSHCVMHFLQ